MDILMGKLVGIMVGRQIGILMVILVDEGVVKLVCRLLERILN